MSVRCDVCNKLFEDDTVVYVLTKCDSIGNSESLEWDYERYEDVAYYHPDCSKSGSAFSRRSKMGYHINKENVIWCLTSITQIASGGDVGYGKAHRGKLDPGILFLLGSRPRKWVVIHGDKIQVETQKDGVLFEIYQRGDYINSVFVSYESMRSYIEKTNYEINREEG